MTIHATSGRIPQFTLGDRLRKAREQAGVGVDEFASEIGVSRNTVTNYEKDHVKPRKIVMKAWALRTGVPIFWLETGIAPTPSPSGDEIGASPDNVRSKGLEPPTFWLVPTLRRLQAA